MSIIYLLILKVVFSQLSATVETGSITGTVTDNRGTPLIGATVMLTGTSLGAMTNTYGMFRIENIPSGSYSLRASMVGMGENTIEKAIVTTDEVLDLRFTLTPYGFGIDYSTILIRI